MNIAGFERYAVDIASIFNAETQRRGDAEGFFVGDFIVGSRDLSLQIQLHGLVELETQPEDLSKKKLSAALRLCVSALKIRSHNRDNP